ncbi:hypothetical protein DPM37_23330 [Salmonella enterica]|nr:hypothetical protein [Salmonella enterica]EDC7808692.1 hypothetical protein [Salmonella enterica subsp. enterica serovar Montevideo]
MKMSESQFIQEVRHRASLLTESFNPGRAITWVRKADNRRQILCLQEKTRRYLSGENTPQEVSAFWGRMETLPEVNAFISCLTRGGMF